MDICDTCGHHANLTGGMCEPCHTTYNDFDFLPASKDASHCEPVSATAHFFDLWSEAERRLEQDARAAGMAVCGDGE